MVDFVYQAKIPGPDGRVGFSSEENEVWSKLFLRQIGVIKDRACPEFIEGLSVLDLKSDEIPELPDVTKKLKAATGWAVVPVKALISFEEFFDLLAHRQFPAATFIRRLQDLDYLKEPDIFHELFGHCPLLTNPDFASFTQKIGELGQGMTKPERVMLARLYWFTVEFGLIRHNGELRIFGGGILSSKNETIYALESPIPKRHEFDLPKILRTAYRYDEMQKNYFIIPSFAELYRIVTLDLKNAFAEAMKHGLVENHDESDVRSC